MLIYLVCYKNMLSKGVNILLGQSVFFTVDLWRVQWQNFEAMKQALGIKIDNIWANEGPLFGFVW